MFKNCTACFGQKTIVGMGMMKISCTTCKGSGQVEDDKLMLDEFLKQKKETQIENKIEEKGEVDGREKGEEAITDNNSCKKKGKRKR